jgi:tape measure domain-containing protein
MSGNVEAGKLLIQVEATTENLKRQLDAALAAVNSATSGMADSVKKVDTAFGGMGDAIEKALGFLGKLTGGFSPVASSMIGVVAAGTGVERMFEKIGEAAIETAKSVAEAGDEHIRLVAQLTAVTGSAEAAVEAFDKLEALTLQTGVAVGQSADMFKRLTVAGKEVGLTTDEVQSLVAILEKAGVAAGASGSEIASVTNSLTVGFLSGTVNARQFRSIITEMPTLAAAIGDSLGMSVEQLMAMAKQGKLTADVLQSGILGAGQSIDTTFAKVPETMDRAWGELKGGMDQFGAALDNALGISQRIALTWHDIAQTAAGWAKIINGPDALEKAANDLEKAKTAMVDVDAELERRAKARSLKQDTIPAPESFTKTVDPLARDQTYNFYAGKTDAQLAEDKAKLLKGVTDAQAAQYELLRHGALAEQAADQAAHATAEKNLDEHNAAILTKLQAGYDKRASIRQKYDEQSAQLDKMQSQLVPGMDNTKAISDIEKARAGILKEETDALDAVTKSEEAHNKKLDEAIKKADDVVASTQLQADKARELYEVHNLGADAIEKANIQAKINQELTRAGIPLIAGATDAWAQQRAEITKNVNTTVTYDDKLKNLTDSQNQAKQAAEEYARQLAQESKAVADQISTGFYDMLTNDKKGQSFLDYFKGLFKKLAVQALSANIVLPIIAPIVSAGASFLGVGTAGGSSQVFNAAGQVIGTLGGGAGAAGVPAGVAGASTGSGLFGGGSVLGSLFPAASAANSISGGSIFSSIGNSLGLTGSGGVFSSGGFLGSGGTVSGLLNTQLWSGATTMMPGPTLSGAAGFMGAPGVTLGSVLGGAGAGFGAGMLVNSLLGGKQTGGTIGSAGGALAGAIAGSFIPGIGTLIGGLIGGAAGGGLGGLIGPGPKHQAFGITVQPNAQGQLAVTNAGGTDTASLKAALDDANAQIAQINQIMGAYGIRATGAGVIGQGNNATQLATFGAMLASGQSLAFRGPAGSDLDTALNTASAKGAIGSPQALSDLVSFVTGTYAALSKTSEKTNQYDDAITALNATYADAISKAQSYGLATDGLTTQLADGVTKINAAHQQAINALQGGADVALLNAQGRTYEANVYGMGSGKQKQLDDLRDQLESLGLSAADAAPWVDKLSQAIDLQIVAVQNANQLAIKSTLIQSQIDALNARGQTYEAGVLKATQDNAAAVKSLTDTLTALGVTADDAKPYIDDLTAALAEQAKAAAADNAESIRQKTASLQLEVMNAEAALDPAKKAAADMASLIEKQYEDQLALQAFMKSHGATIDEMVKAYTLLGDAQQKERDALAATTDAVNNSTSALNNAGQSIQAYIDKLNSTNAAGASPIDQYAAASTIYGQQLALAKSGDQTALGNITSNADNLLQAAKAMFGSGAGYQNVVSMIKETLTGLPATVDYNAEILKALQALGGSIDVNVELDVVRRISETLMALSDTDKAKLQVSETVLHTVEEQMGRQLTNTEFDRIMALAGLSPEVIQTIDQSMQGMTPDQYVQAFKLADLDPAVLQQVTQTLKTLGTAFPTDDVTKTITQNLTDTGASEITPDDLLKKITQLVTNAGADTISGDPILKDIQQSISNIGVSLVTEDTIWKQIYQSLANIGDEIITSDSLYKSIVQDVTTTEALTVHISDTLDGIFGEIKLVLDAINYQTSLTAYNTGVIATNSYGGGENAGREANLAGGGSNPADLSQAGPGDAGGAGYALGGVFSHGRVIPFASGGIFNQRTYAPIALFGEAGPEAIMPLTRDSSGKLGVSVMGGSGPSSHESGSDVTSAFAQVGGVIRDEIRLMRTDIQDLRSTLRRAVAK